MAMVRTLREDSKVATRVHPTEVDCGWHVLLDGNGNRLLQLSTYGSDNRQSEPKVSQTLQLDRATALALARVIKDVYGS